MTSKPKVKKMNRPMVFLPSLQREEQRGEKGERDPWESPPPKKEDPMSVPGPSRNSQLPLFLLPCSCNSFDASQQILHCCGISGWEGLP